MASTLVLCSLAACRAPTAATNAPAKAPASENVGESAGQSATDSTGEPTDEPNIDSAGEPAGEPTDEQGSEPPRDWSSTQAAEESDGLAIHGMFSTRYRGRFTDGDHDNDLYEFFKLDVGDPEKDAWSGTIVADAALDLDGHEDPSSPFQSISDTYESSLTARLYEAYVDNHSSKDLSRLRIGRQIVDRTPETVTFDGVQIQSRDLGQERVSLGVYGGIPARIYSSSEPGDVVYGTFVDARPWSGGHARFDWMHLEDDELLGEHQDDLLALRLGQAFGQSLKVDGSYSRLEGRNRDVSARATYTQAESDFDVSLAWFQLLETQNDLAIEFDPFTTVLLEQFPFYQARVMASKGFGATFRLQAGFDVREVADEDDVGEFNHDFTREWLTASLTDVLPGEIDLSLTGEVWNSDTDDIQTWGADLSRDLGSKARLALGSYFSLYKADLYAVEERDDVRTYYIRLRTRNDTGWSWNVGYEFEDSLAHYSTLRLGATWRF